MDVRASKDVLRLKKFGSGCTNTADLVVVCDVGTRYDSWAGWSGALPYAAPGSKAGDTGRLRMTYEAPDGHVATATTRVVVGGPILEVRAPKVVGGIRPGAETSMDSGGAQHGRDHRPRRRPAADRRQRAAAVTALRELPLQRGRSRRADRVLHVPRPALATGPDRGVRPRPADAHPKVIDHADLRQSAWPLDLGPYEAVRMTSPGPAGDGPRLEPVSAHGRPGRVER
ncbi:hypothetical protein [Streptomyces sp. KL116D]|uniref:hypothetical protein n=1 Tax=Streptomyces sp. KL116D TaxID=3045152 RepID=UPI003556EAF3